MTREADFPLRERGAHRARWLGTVDAAYAEMRRLIDAATTRICFESYIVRPDGPALWLREALLRAQLRGVQVEVLLDAFGCEELPADYFAELTDVGGHVHRFNPLKLLRLSFRNHRKLLCCDDKVAVIGGFNFGREYEGDGVRRGWRDLGLFVEGPVVRDLAASFDAMLRLAPFSPPLIAAFRYRSRRWNRPVPPTAGSEVRLLVSGPPLQRGWLRRQLRRDLRLSKEVAIAEGYFLPPWDVRRAMRACVRGGGRIRLLLSGRSDVPVARLAAEYLYPWLLRLPAEIHEYRPQILHAKLIVMDDIAYAGSCNLDRRSLHINFELLLRLDWPEMAADAREWCEEGFKLSRRLRLNTFRRRRSLWRRLMSRLAYLLLARVDPLIARRGFRALR